MLRNKQATTNERPQPPPRRLAIVAKPDIALLTRMRIRKRHADSLTHTRGLKEREVNGCLLHESDANKRDSHDYGSAILSISLHTHIFSLACVYKKAQCNNANKERGMHTHTHTRTPT